MIKKKIFPVVAALILGVSIALAGCSTNHHKESDQASGLSVDTNQSKQSTSESTSNQNETTTEDTPSQENTGKTNTISSGTKAPSETPAIKVNMREITSVRLADPQTGWTGGNGWIAKTVDGGENWHVQYKGSGMVKQIFALNHQKVWATLDQGGNSLRLLQSNDGGLNWTLIGTTPNKAYLHFISNTAGLSGNAFTEDSGRTWKQLSTPQNMVGNVYFHDLKNGWAVTQNNKILSVQKTIDGGAHWNVVLTKKLTSPIVDTIIRSAGTRDAWVECIGDSGMTQTSYSVFHTTDGGNSWKTVLANATAGGGPAPGVDQNQIGAHNKGSKPGPLYVVNPQIAYMAGVCQACDAPNSIGWTKDGGDSWINSNVTLSGYGDSYLAIADANHGWWITTESTKPSIMYTTSDGGIHWTQVHTFR